MRRKAAGCARDKIQEQIVHSRTEEFFSCLDLIGCVCTADELRTVHSGKPCYFFALGFTVAATGAATAAALLGRRFSLSFFARRLAGLGALGTETTIVGSSDTHDDNEDEDGDDADEVDEDEEDETARGSHGISAIAACGRISSIASENASKCG